MTCDIVLRNGTVVDGSGAPARRADIGITGGKIVPPGPAKRTIDIVIFRFDRLELRQMRQMC